MTDRDKLRLAGCHPRLLTLVCGVLNKFPMFIVQGVRTVEQQQTLYAQGRTAPGPIVTNCDGVHSRSNHQTHADGFGHAVDIAWIPNDLIKDPFSTKWPWHDMGTYAEAQGLIWGGHFHTLIDMPHLELPDSPGSGH